MRRWLVAFVVLVSSPAFGQDCFRNQIGLDPVFPTLTLDQWNAGINAAAQIVPRLADGTPSPQGKVRLLSIGLSSTRIVYKGFTQKAKSSGQLKANVILHDGAIAGYGASEWADPNCPCWSRLLTALAKTGSGPGQVAAIYLMVTIPKPTLPPAENAVLFAQYIRQIRANLTAKGFINRKIDYLASHYYGGYDVGQDKIPEPSVYYEGLTLQALQDESFANQDPVFLNAVPGYQWTDGERVRSDGLYLPCSAMDPDGVHLNRTFGMPLIGGALFDRMLIDPTTRPWLFQ